jgi:uncharacterized membrane protein YhaH (DUF805 family)
VTDLDPNRNSKAAGPQWHLHIPPETYGPYSLQQLRDYAREGRLNADTLVWSEGADGWGRAGDQAALRGLFAVAAPARAPAPPAPPVSAARAAPSSYVLGSSGAVAVAGGPAGVMESVASGGYMAAPAGPRMGFAQAVRTCMKEKYFTFQGRAARAEFWWFGLFIFIILAVVYSIAGWLAVATMSDGSMSIVGDLAIAVAALIVLVFFIPGIAVTVRRLHDLGYSGWWYLAQLIPVVGGIISIIMFIGFLMRGNVGTNRFGPDPLAEGF